MQGGQRTSFSGSWFSIPHSTPLLRQCLLGCPRQGGLRTCPVSPSHPVSGRLALLMYHSVCLSHGSWGLPTGCQYGAPNTYRPVEPFSSAPNFIFYNCGFLIFISVANVITIQCANVYKKHCPSLIWKSFSENKANPIPCNCLPDVWQAVCVN